MAYGFNSVLVSIIYYYLNESIRKLLLITSLISVQCDTYIIQFINTFYGTYWLLMERDNILLVMSSALKLPPDAAAGRFCGTEAGSLSHCLDYFNCQKGFIISTLALSTLTNVLWHK